MWKILTMCDAYNPFERTELVTRHALELIDAFGFGISMLTKSDLILRDTDIYQSISEHSPVLCMTTITAADDGLSKKVEPGASPSSWRFQAVRALSDAGLCAGVVMTPLLPFLEDTEENIREMVRLSKEAGARFIYGIMGAAGLLYDMKDIIHDYKKKYECTQLKFDL